MTLITQRAGVRVSVFSRQFHIGSLFVAALVAPGLASAQSPSQQPQNTAANVDFVVTPSRTPTPISRAGSAVSVITADEIAKASPRDVGDLLRQVPGVSVTQTGGAGGTQTARIRGLDSRHTLVMVDGVRVNDASSPGGEFDFSNIVLADVERIEVLRGPQSALYGSDAIGGVINVITKKGRGAPKGSLTVEGGSYGTRSVRANVSGGTEKLSYSFGITGYETAGFSRFGYRIGRLTSRFPQPFEADGAERFGAAGRISYRINDAWEVEVGGGFNSNRAQFDSAFGNFPDSPSVSVARMINGYGKITGDTFGGMWRHSLSVFGTETQRESRGWNYFAGGPIIPTGGRSDFGFRSFREGAEYQSDLKLGSFGTFIAGAKIEREHFSANSQNIAPVPGFQIRTDKAQQTTRSIFALHQITLAERLHLSLGGRIDDVEDVDRFATWRGTVAYEVPGTETKLRASVGTGGKAPSLYQFYSQLYGTRTLESERSVGIDAGVDQTLLDGRVKLSGTVFFNRYRNFIDFAASPRCRPDQIFGCYLNVARAETSGFEGETKIDLIPQWLKLRATYTYMDAVDLVRSKKLALRPEHEGRFGFIITPMKDLTIEPIVTMVGPRFSAANETQKLKSYARLDMNADYKLNERVSLFTRLENLTNAHYQEVRNYGTPGRSIYGGLRATW
jgi:vitamin B12 transporter